MVGDNCYLGKCLSIALRKDTTEIGEKRMERDLTLPLLANSEMSNIRNKTFLLKGAPTDKRILI